MIHSYLCAERGSYEKLDSSNNRFISYAKFLETFYASQGVRLHFIKSSKAQTEIINFNHEIHIVFDRQVDLYINALKIANVLDFSRDFADRIHASYVYIASLELFAIGRPHLAKEIHKTYCKDINFNARVDVIGELCRVHFIIDHELAHIELQNNDYSKLSHLTDIASKFVKNQHMVIADNHNNSKKKWFLRVNYNSIYENKIREECTSDLISFTRSIDMLQNDKQAEGCLGGILNYMSNVIDFLYHIEQIKDIKRAVFCAINNVKLTKNDRFEKQMRIHISQRIIAEMINEIFDLETAEEWVRQTSNRINEIESLSDGEILSQVYNLVHCNRETFDENEQPELNSEYCISISKWN